MEVDNQFLVAKSLDSLRDLFGRELGGRIAVEGLVRGCLQAFRGHEIIVRSRRFLFKKTPKNTAFDEIQLEFGEADYRRRLIVYTTVS